MTTAARPARARARAGRAVPAPARAGSARPMAPPQPRGGREHAAGQGPGAVAEAVGAGRRQPCQGQEAEAARGRASRHQGRARQPGAAARAERRQAGRPQQQRQAERERPIGADAAVAHDGELALAGAPAAEAVGRVGEPVLVQPAAGQHRRGDRPPPSRVVR